MPKSLLNLLKMYLTLGVDVDQNADPDPEPEADPEPEESDDPAEEPEGEEGNDPDPAPEPQRASRKNDDIRTARETAQRERERAIRAEAERDTLRQSNQRPATDPTFEQEEQRLRQLDLNTFEGRQEKWQIDSNRELRSQREQTNRMVFEARNIEDRTNFREYANDRNPGYFKAYSKRVEDKFAEALRAGQPQSRTVLFKLMLADDLLEGRIKSTKTGSTGDTGKKAAIPRGKSPGARSDVQRSGSSARQKLVARLEGKPI